MAPIQRQMAEDNSELASLTADIVAAYVSNNEVPASDLGTLISSVHTALGAAGQSVEPSEPETQKPAAAEIRKSRQPDYLTSFIDGKQYKSLKRHLGVNGMKPDEYRAKFGLPKDYPMVAGAYSAQRSALAKTLGLGRKSAAQPEPEPAVNPPRRRGSPGRSGR